MMNKTCKDCIHERVCCALIKEGLPYADGEYPAEAFCMAFKDKSRYIELPCAVGDTFYGIKETSYDAYCVCGFKFGKRRGEDENVLIVLTTYELEFVWGDEAFATEEEAKQKLDILKDLKERNRI